MTFFDKSQTPTKIVALILICCFPLGAYFIYDAPACVMKYFKAGLGLNNTEYMDFYFYYSLPGIVMTIVSGIIIDNILGHGLGSIVFCGFVFFGQLLFSYAVSVSSTVLAILGRMLCGTGVESIAVASNVYLDRWFKGTSMQSLAFGTALAVWRFSSSLSLISMTPYYKSINEVTPRDGSTLYFSTCKECIDENNQATMISYGPQYDTTNQTNYYCYDKNIVEACSLTTQDKVNLWNVDQKLTACPSFSDQVNNFISQSKVIEYGCMKVSEDGKFWEWDEAICNCLNSNYDPKDERLDMNKFLQDNLRKYRNTLEQEDNTSWLDKFGLEVSDFTDDKLQTYLDPFYWHYFGVGALGESLEDKDRIEKRNALVRALNQARCADKVPLDFVRYVDTEKTSGFSDVGDFYQRMSNPGLFGSACNSTYSYWIKFEKKESSREITDLVFSDDTFLTFLPSSPHQ